MQKAWFYEKHGPKEVLMLDMLPLPVSDHGQVLVRIQAAALNPIDFKRRQLPMFISDLPAIPGCDMAGIVVEVGPGVAKLKPGDEVYGNVQDFDTEGKFRQRRTLAEYVAVEESLLAAKPPQISFEEAASLPVAMQTAVEGFRNGRFRPGQSIFVVGGAGGVGSIVVQLAKQCLGASRVVASCSTKKLEFVRGLGADAVVDYTATNYEDVGEKFDFVFDTIGESARSAVLAKENAPVIDLSCTPTSTGAVFLGPTVKGEMLEGLRQYLDSGKLRAVIDPTGPYRFVDAVEAFAYLEKGRAWGKVVINSFPSSTS